MFLFFLIAVVPGDTTLMYMYSVVTSWFLEQAPQWLNVETHCQTAILLFTDRDWLPLTNDVIRDLERFGHCRCIALWYWTQPNETVDPASNLLRGNPVLIDNRAVRGANWGSPAYFSKIGERVPIALAILLCLSKRVGLALFDSDIVIQRNVVTRLERLSSTIAIQREVVCSNARGRCANGGFWRVHNTHDAHKLLLDVDDVMDDLHVPDQEAFDIVLADVHVTYLDPLLYATGYVVQHNDTWDFTRSHMLHANWCVTLACKRAFLRDARRGRFDLIRQKFGNKKDYY